MITHTVRVIDREILISNPKIIANCENSDLIELDLDDEWDGRNILIVLGTGYDSLVCEYDGDPVIFPNKLLTESQTVPISIVGYLDASNTTENSRIITAETDKKFEVVNSGSLPSKQVMP